MIDLICNFILLFSTCCPRFMSNWLVNFIKQSGLVDAQTSLIEATELINRNKHDSKCVIQNMHSPIRIIGIVFL